MKSVRRFFDPEPRWSAHFVAFALVAGLIWFGSWALFLLALHFGFVYMLDLWALIYESPDSYLMYSVLPCLAIWAVWTVGYWLLTAISIAWAFLTNR